MFYIDRDNVVAEVHSIPKEELSVEDDKKGSTSTDQIITNEDCLPKLSDAMDQLQSACTSFDSLYSNDLKGWVNRMPKVVTNSNLEQKTEDLKRLLSSISEKTNAISTIRASCNGIASKSRQLDSILCQPKTNKCLTDTRI